jgi:prepilin-type N-terminal cleavage/methylation domain-containing protein
MNPFPKNSPQKAKKGFTLIELMVAMSITTIIVLVLVSVTSIALDTWNRSRAEVRAARQAKAMTDTMARDLEALVTRRGNKYQWLFAEGTGQPPGENLPSTNANELIFFTSATDRYEGQINTGQDLGGDVSCVSYRLEYKDPITGGTGGGAAGGGRGDFPTYVLNRLLVNPDETFQNLLAQESLKSAFSQYSARLSEPENFVCENVYQFSTTFHIEVTVEGQRVTVPVKLGSQASAQTVNQIAINGSGLEAPFQGASLGSIAVTADQMRAGRVTAVEVALTVLSDFAVEQLRNRRFANTQAQADFVAKNSYQYSKVVEVPGM